MKKIAITGTKGKTTTAYLIDVILRNYRKNVLRVDTTGHFVNGKCKSDCDESKRIWGIVPTICPGRFLWEFKKLTKKQEEKACAVMECSLGSNGRSGLGYKFHDIAVWTNVYDDHIGSNEMIQTREDIANEKKFIFKMLHPDSGCAIFNADDRLICSKIRDIPKNCNMIPCSSSDFKNFDIENHLKNGGEAFCLKGTQIIKIGKDAQELIYDAEKLPWVFNGDYQPSLLNLMYAIAAVYATLDNKIPANFSRNLNHIRLDPYGGRMVVLEAKNGATIIADYAHEVESLTSVALLAKKMALKKSNSGKTIGVVRLSYDRIDKLIEETGKAVGRAFDEVVVYDKIDGYWRKPVRTHSKFKQEVGRVSELLTKSIGAVNQNVERFLREDKAIEFAASRAGKNDVVVIIVNDNVRRSINWIREKFVAKFK